MNNLVWITNIILTWLTNINLIGLTFGFLGALILFIFNNPYRGQASYWTSKETVKRDKIEKNKLQVWQRIGFALIAIGFLLQIVSVLR